MRAKLSFLHILVIFATVLAVDSCGRSKPCRCTQQTGCHCPLPPLEPKANTTKPAAAPQREVTSMNPPAGHVHFGVRHLARVYPHDKFVQLNDQRSNHKSEHLAVAEKDPSGGGLRRRSAYGGAFNLSRGYSHSHGRRKYADGYAPRESRRYKVAWRYGADGSYLPAAGSPMSINSPAALDPWHGYNADCPDAHSGE